MILKIDDKTNVYPCILTNLKAAASYSEELKIPIKVRLTAMLHQKLNRGTDYSLQKQSLLGSKQFEQRILPSGQWSNCKSDPSSLR